MIPKLHVFSKFKREGLPSISDAMPRLFSIAHVPTRQGGVLAYPVSQAYGSLDLGDNSEVDEAVLGRCSVSCAVSVPSSSQPKNQTHGLQGVLLGEDLVISPTCKVGGLSDQMQKGLEWSWDISSRFLSPTLMPYPSKFSNTFCNLIAVV